MTNVSAVRLKGIGRSALLELLDKIVRNQISIEGLMANPVQETIVIPVNLMRSSDSLVIQYWLRLPTLKKNQWGNIEGCPATVMSIVFRDRVESLQILSAGPTQVAVGRNYADLGSYSLRYTQAYQWIPMQIFLDGNTLTFWRSDISSASGLNPTASVTSPINFRSELTKIEAVFWAGDEGLLAYQDDRFMIGEVRIWEGLGWSQANSLDTLMRQRLDGREPGLVGYWKLGEGQGTRIEDSSRYGHHGMLTGGNWVSAADSGLTLDCVREIGRDNLRRQRKEIAQQLDTHRPLHEDIAKLTQEKQRLDTHVDQIKANQKDLDERLKQDLQARDAALQKLEGDYRAWQDDIEDGGKVAVSAFSNAIAQELDRATQRLNTAQSPYSLQSVALEVKALPVAGQDDTGMRLRFPSMDDQKIQSDQLSTLRMSFAARPSEPVRARAAVPDVRGCTEALARRQLGLSGFRVEVLDQAARSKAEIGRVVSQVPSHDVLAEPDKIVRVFIGRPSGAGAPAGTGGTGEGALEGTQNV